MGQGFGTAAFAYLTVTAVKKFHAIRIAANTMDSLGQNFGLVQPGPFLRGGFPFDVAVFQRCLGCVTLGTIQTAIGDHVHSFACGKRP